MGDLNRQQEEAVGTGPVDLFIAAGAGSGKTRVLAERFVHAVLGEAPYERCEPDEVVAVTFTDKAATELSQRVRSALSVAGDTTSARRVGDAWISTIHGMCSRILRQHAFAVGIDPQFRVLDQIESSALEAEALEDAVIASAQTAEGSELFESYGMKTVVDAARAIRASVAAQGLTPSDVETLEPGAIRARLGNIARELAELSDDFRTLRSVKTVSEGAATVERVAAAIKTALDDDALDPRGALAEMSARGLRRVASVEGLNELVDEATALVEEAQSCWAQLSVGRLEVAFLTFLRLFDERFAWLKTRAGALDFEDLQTRTMALLETHPEIAAAYRARFKMIMLDEFQDTNALQLRIIEQLACGNLCTVGDENQSIYAFRHADVQVFRERGRQVAEHRTLQTNYRSQPDLLEAVNGVFSHAALLGPGFMALQPPETISGDERDSETPALTVTFIDLSAAKGVDHQSAEAECIADQVERMVAGGQPPGSTVVLMRALAGGRGVKVERALNARGIPSYLVSGGAFFESAAVVEARSLLQVVANVWDDSALVTALAGQIVGLGPTALLAIRQEADCIRADADAKPWDVHLWDGLISENLSVEAADRTAIERFIAAVDGARRRRGLRGLADTVLQSLLALDADLALFASGEGGARAWSNLQKLVRLADDYESATGGDLDGFLEYLDMRETHSTSEQEATLDGESDAVRIMSIHAAKGLEFDNVVVGGLSGGGALSTIAVGKASSGQPLLGMKLVGGDAPVLTVAWRTLNEARRAADEAEAVRLLYVACTRARRDLAIVARTDAEKPAEDGLIGALRCALGVGGENDLTPGAACGSPVLRNVNVHLVEPPAGLAGSDRPEPTPDSAPSAHQPVPHPANAAADEAESTGCGEDSGAGVGVRHADVPSRVSYTALATYGECPYRYYLTSIARLPAAPAAQGGQALIFGTAVHEVLERCRTRDTDAGDLVARVRQTLGLDARMTSRLASAVEAYRGLPVAGDVWSAERVLREAPIAVPVARTVLAGAIDVIAWTGDAALIVDYKTGTAPLSTEEALDRYRLQSQCYALAALSAGASSVRVVFAELERGRETSYLYSADDCETIASVVASIIERMEREGFPARERYTAELCETCPGLGGMCSVSRPSGRAAG